MNVLARAKEIAEEVLLPATIEVDRTGVVPASHLDLLAEEGFYGLAARPDVDFAEMCQVLETLASGCLCTTFVWMQHNGVVLRLARVNDRRLPLLTTGRRRAGVALGGTVPGPPRLTMSGHVLDGQSPWVTGWGMIDTLLVAARDGDDIVWSLVDAKESDTLSVEPLDMVAVSASNTVTATFTGHVVPADRVVGRQPYAEWAKADAAGLRLNGSLALGLTARCCALLGPSQLDEQLAATRTQLDNADPEQLPDARAEASALAVRAATTLVASTGSNSIRRDQHAQKLARESLFLLVFATRKKIKEALLQKLNQPNKTNHNKGLRHDP